MIGNPGTFIAIIGIVIFSAFLIGFCFMIYYDRQNTAAVTLLKSSLDAYRADDSHARVTSTLTKNVLCRLFQLPSIAFDGDDLSPARRWRLADYTDLFEIFMAVGSDPDFSVALVYGSLAEGIKARKRNGQPYKELIWMEYTYRGKNWILWVDPDRQVPDDSLLRNDSYRMFHSFGEVVTHMVYQYDMVHEIFDFCTNPTN